mmetsp:Transcript_28662/g.88853  ORF Transcript_28662/g.88853 Transcript_28662/m.88853 type:complete len:96 (+) Transcript_28662:893-1180(+)
MFLQWLSLLVIGIGAIGFACHSTHLIADAVVLFWAFAYLTCITADMHSQCTLLVSRNTCVRLAVKRVVNRVNLSPWGYVYYNNSLALVIYLRYGH